MQVDCLITPTTQWKGRALIEAVHTGAEKVGLDSRIVTNGKPRSGAYIVLYGLGGSDRIQYAGWPNVISFDAGYWQRKLDVHSRKYRVSIGGFHCPARIFLGESPGPARWAESGLTIHRDGGDPNGPILLVGNGPKSNRIGASDWCADMSRKLREWFPGRTIWYRPKPKRPHDRGVVFDALAEKVNIDAVIARCSLVVCRHSNVAVDCARLGVACVCIDGAARAIYREPPIDCCPGVQVRTEFLHRLAWWQWSMTEIREGKFWPWMLNQLALT